jgi:hypothetical protein
MSLNVYRAPPKRQIVFSAALWRASLPFVVPFDHLALLQRVFGEAAIDIRLPYSTPKEQGV